MSKEYPSLLETKLGEAVIRGGMAIALTCFIAGIIAPVFIPWAFRYCKSTMPEGLSPEAYQTELNSRKTTAVIIVLVIWVISIAFMWFAYATAPY